MALQVRTDESTGETEVTFRVPGLAYDGDISVVGSFNAWTPGTDVLARQADGTCAVTVRVPRGADVHFRYLGSGGVWFDDPEADEVNQFGSVIHLSERSGSRLPPNKGDPLTEHVIDAPADSGDDAARVRSERNTSRSRTAAGQPAPPKVKRARPKQT
jgi:hypothetical protein